MAETSKIEWTDATFNPWIGCTKCSPGCENCYAERDFGPKSRHPMGGWGADEPRHWTSEANWKKPLAWNRKCERENRRMTVFCGSICDIADPEVSQIWFSDVIRLVLKTPNLNWLFLTKRPEELKRRLDDFYKYSLEYRFVIPNLWLGVTACNQEETKKVWTLLKTPAAGRFVSIEPMLGPIDLNKFELLCKAWSRRRPTLGTYLDWVICGGETGPKARPLHPDNVASLRDQCQSTETPFFFKQWGEWSPWAPMKNGVYDLCSGITLAPDGTIYRGGDLTYPGGPRRGEAYRAGHDKANLTSMYRIGKAAAGCLLDGKEYKEFPEALK